LNHNNRIPELNDTVAKHLPVTKVQQKKFEIELHLRE